MEEIKRLVIEIDGEEYEMTAGGGQPGPDSVGTEEIKDGAVEMEDLNADVKDKMTHHYDQQGEGIVLGGIVDDNSHDVGQGGSEDSDDDEAGFENNADDGSDDI